LALDSKVTPKAAEEDIQTQLQRFQLKQLMREEAERDASIDRRRKASLAIVEGTREAMEGQKIFQEMGCAHVKPNGNSVLAGQRLSNGDLFLVCQICQKEWRAVAGDNYYRDKKGNPLAHQLVPTELARGVMV
jgi:hypothetical protein